MKRAEWIVCERTSRWAAALRTTAARHAADQELPPRIVQVRRMDELTARLDQQPGSLAFVEVDETNLAMVLEWLAKARDIYPQACAIALLDYALTTQQTTRSSADENTMQDVASALLEAGAVDVADSRRNLHNTLAIAERHRLLGAIDEGRAAVNQPLAEWARSLLPWQDRS